MRYNVSLNRFDDGATRAHLIRYYVARGFIEPGDTVIDAACGTGYGSEMMSRVAEKVYAYDQLEKINYRGDIKNIEYNNVNLEKQYNYPECDVAVSLETIEHLTAEGAKVFIDSLLPQVKRMFVFSVPLNEEPGANPFHKQVFNEGSAWNTVMRGGWKPFHTLKQGNHLIGSIYR